VADEPDPDGDVLGLRCGATDRCPGRRPVYTILALGTPGLAERRPVTSLIGDDAFHPPLRHITPDALSDETAQTPGMSRRAAISSAMVGSSKVWMGQTHVGPASASENHHHGETETAIYIVSGTPVFVFLADGAEVRLETHPGDYVFVPPWARHREENPSPDTEAVVVIARSSQEAIVVNLPELTG